MKNTVYSKIEKSISECDKNIITEGIEWYKKANKEIIYSATELNVEIDLFAKIVAILSPYNKWENNIDDAYKLIFALKYERENLEKLTFTTFKANVEKAIKAYENNLEFNDEKSGFKTYAFYRNLMLDDQYVTIDRHMLKLVDIEKDFGLKVFTKKAYTELSVAFKKVAKKYGLKAYELQSILWLNLRNKK